MTITYELGQSLYLNITNRCANACSFCLRNNTDVVGQSDSLWLEREPSLEEICADIDRRDLSSYDSVVFCGFGEPLERLDDVIAAARYIKKKEDIPVRLNTNGLSDLMYERPTAKELAGVIDTVSISLNAPTPEEYNEICNSRFGFVALPAVLAFAKDCTKYVPEVVLSVVDSIGPEKVEQCRVLTVQTGARFRVRTYVEGY